VRVAVEALVRRAGLVGVGRADVARGVYRRVDEVEPHVGALLAEGRVLDVGRGLLLHADAAARGVRALLDAVTRFHERSPLAVGMRKSDLPPAIGASPEVVDGLLERCRERRLLEPIEGGRVRAFGRAPRLSPQQQARVDAILAALAADPWQTPRSDHVAALVSGLPAEVEQLLALLEQDGRIVRLRDGILLLAETVEDAKRRIAEHVERTGSLAPSDLKDLLGATLKYSIPLL
jgi:hypothetical protein